MLSWYHQRATAFGISLTAVFLVRYESKSEVVEYKTAADVTVPRKRELEDGAEEEKPKPKKIKVSWKTFLV